MRDSVEAVIITQFIMFLQHNDVWFHKRTIPIGLKSLTSKEVLELKDKFVIRGEHES